MSVDDKAIIQYKIGSTGSVVLTHSGKLGEKDCVLAVVQKNIKSFIEHALFIFNTDSVPLKSSADLASYVIVPVDENFVCDFESISDPDGTGLSVLVHLTGSDDAHVVLQLTEGEATNLFISEVFRLVDSSPRGRGSGYLWNPPASMDTTRKPEMGLLEQTVQDCTDLDAGWPWTIFSSVDQFLVISQTFTETLRAGNYLALGRDEDMNVKMNVLKAQATFATELFVRQVKYVEARSAELPLWASLLVSSNNYTFLDSSEMALQRQNIAKGGQSSVAAREKMIKQYMSLKSEDYTYNKSIRVLAATWNVNGQAATVSLAEWLNTVDGETPDIYAVGFQELDLTKEAFLFNETPREGEWLDAVTQALQSHRKVLYRKVCLVRLVGMMLLVFVQDKHMDYIRNIAWETVGTGIMGKMGNKGGVAVRFDFHSTSVCFVNSHLAAHVEEFERRNQDFNDIISRMSFTVQTSRYTIKDHDHIYWLGDLNYRVTELLPTVVKDLVDNHNYAPILEYDQLNQQKLARRVFDGYKEGAILFKPTYKYDTGTDNWDSSEKNRAPAWCDRILWKGEGIEQLSYSSHPALKISDHKPVRSLFQSKVRIIDEAKQRKVHEDVIKCLDKLENEFLPQVMVDTNEVVFDTVRYLEPCIKELIIANTGQVPAQFEFIKKLDDSTYCKDWLYIEPSEGLIAPGEKCDVKLEVLVNKRSACKLNSGEDKLYDILVLHLEGGKDIFVTVSGSYERSCFGCSIEALVHISVPIREISIGRLVELENNKVRPSGNQDPYPIPKEMWFLIDHLYRHGLKQQLFVQPGLHSEIIQIRNWLDNGSSDPLPGSVHSVAEALLLLLESTSEPVIPYSLHVTCLNSSSNYIQCKQTTQQLSQHRRNVFLYLCAFLQELLNHSEHNELDPRLLATLFGRIFLRDPPGRRNDPVRDRSSQADIDRKKCNFVYHFLVNDQSDFILGR